MRTRPPLTLGQPKPTSSSSTRRILGEPSGACLFGGKSGFDSVAYISMCAFGNSHGGSGRWLRSRWSGNERPLAPFVFLPFVRPDFFMCHSSQPQDAAFALLAARAIIERDLR